MRGMYATFSLISISKLCCARYKREAYRHSEFAPRILAENGLTVLMKVVLLPMTILCQLMQIRVTIPL